MKRTIREHYEHLYHNKLEKLNIQIPRNTTTKNDFKEEREKEKL